MARRKRKKSESRGQEENGNRKPRTTEKAALRRRSGPNWPVVGFALAGAVLTAYLTATLWLGEEPLYCGEGSSCDIVQHSRWGKFLGISTSFWGLLAFLTLGYIAFRVRNPERHWKFLWTLSLAGLGYSLYLTGISVEVIGVTCAYCLISLALMGAIFLTLVFQRPRGLPAFAWVSWVAQTGVLAVAVVLALHLHYRGVFDAAAGPEDPYLRAIAEHLEASGAVFYGAYW